jgi:PadR family transcriptional regulator PadR
MPTTLGELEQLVLLALLRLGPDAYGVSVQRELEREARRELTLGTVYKTLVRLEEKRLVTTHLSPATAERGGRRKKCYRVLPAGDRALRRSLDAIRRLADGLDPALELR